MLERSAELSLAMGLRTLGYLLVYTAVTVGLTRGLVRVDWKQNDQP